MALASERRANQQSQLGSVWLEAEAHIQVEGLLQPLGANDPKVRIIHIAEWRGPILVVEGVEHVDAEIHRHRFADGQRLGCFRPRSCTGGRYQSRR